MPDVGNFLTYLEFGQLAPRRSRNCVSDRGDPATRSTRRNRVPTPAVIPPLPVRHSHRRPRRGPVRGRDGPRPGGTPRRLEAGGLTPGRSAPGQGPAGTADGHRRGPAVQPPVAD